MANTFIKPEVVVGSVVGALIRETILPQLVWLDPAGDFTGAKNDTLNLSIPSVTSARTRAMRSGTTRTRDALAEGKVALVLDTDLYKDVVITDEELTLDIKDFGAQVLAPITAAMAQGWEDEIADTMHSATYAHSIGFDDDDIQGVFVDAKTQLDKANVPMSGRAAALGSNLAALVGKNDQFRRYDSSGDLAVGALREATVERIAGFRIVTAPGLDPDEGFCFHRTAYAASSKVPVVPAGVSYGASISAQGFAMRVIRDFDSSATGWADILGFDAFIGSTAVKDHGAFNSAGKWVPSDSPDNTNQTDAKLIRAVKLVGPGS